MFQFNIPGVGSFTVHASSLARARQLVQNQIAALGFPIGATEIQQALSAGFEVTRPADVPAGSTVITDPNPAGGVGGGPGGTGVAPPAPAPPPGGDDQGDVGLEGAADRGATDLTQPPGSTGNPAQPVGSLPPEERPGGEVGLDIQSFPFASFQNALSARGLNPQGVLGPTLNQAFSRLSPALDIGTLTGSIAPIGEGPGALQAFFENNLQNASSLPLNVFQNLSGQGQGADFVNAAPGTRQFNALRDLAQGAAANRFGGLVSRLLPSDEVFRHRFERQLAASPGGSPQNLLDFARAQFGF